MTEKHLYSDEFDTYVAESLDQAHGFMCEHIGMTEEQRKRDGMFLDPVPDDKEMRVYVGEDDGCIADADEYMKNSKVKTAKEWAAEQPLGFFCSTEC